MTDDRIEVPFELRAEVDEKLEGHGFAAILLRREDLLKLDAACKEHDVSPEEVVGEILAGVLHGLEMNLRAVVIGLPGNEIGPEILHPAISFDNPH